MSIEILDTIVRLQKQGVARGITSICSAHPIVLETVMGRAKRNDSFVLVESTCNQVNQYGGYTGMTPAAFAEFLSRIAHQVHLPIERIILGGDHLGPNVWQNEPEDIAMARSIEMVKAYIEAGYTKIHLDASMKLANDDPVHPLSPEVAARRAAVLAVAAERAAQASGGMLPRYVIGTEVPTPGGAHSQAEGLCITSSLSAQESIDSTHAAFVDAGLESAWERVIALVVQPGVEFGDHFVHNYQPDAAIPLARFIEGIPDLIYEAHSTDYQVRQALENLVRDHFAILKVGPALTFAYREAIFILASIENEIIREISRRSNIIQTIDNVMLRSPQHWSKYYQGNEWEQSFARKYSFSDRLRYYWPDPDIQNALKLLFNNLGEKPIPMALISQYAPRQYEKIRSGEIANSPPALIRHQIGLVLEDYEYACGY